MQVDGIGNAVHAELAVAGHHGAAFDAFLLIGKLNRPVAASSMVANMIQRMPLCQ